MALARPRPADHHSDDGSCLQLKVLSAVSFMMAVYGQNVSLAAVFLLFVAVLWLAIGTNWQHGWHPLSSLRLLSVLLTSLFFFFEKLGLLEVLSEFQAISVSSSITSENKLFVSTVGSGR